MSVDSSGLASIPPDRPTPFTYHAYTYTTAAFIGCGQDAANAYCKAIGYDSATAFVKDEQITEPTVYLLQVLVRGGLMSVLVCTCV